MATCIICGADVDGAVCSTHEEDVWFEFRGHSPSELTPGRYYRGDVDGFADFGVFVNVGDGVTGLLHRSELPTRPENLDWSDGEVVFVQVKGVRENGNVDLGWSIRQSDREFRGALIDDPDEGTLVREEDATEATGTDGTASGRSDGGSATATTNGGASVVRDATSGRDQRPAQVADPTRRPVEDLADHVGERVRLEGEIADVRQTSGPTIFEVADETGAVECAAFVEAGVRAYPEIEVGDVVRLDGEIERRRGDLQVETEALTELDGDERAAVEGRLTAALDEQTRPPEVDLLAEEPAVEAIEEPLREAAHTIRRAVVQSRPIVVRHAATADGYVAGAAIERAVLPLVRDEHATADAEYHYFDRRPLADRFYEMDDVTNDLTTMLENRERHGEKLPLVVLVGAGATRESADSFELLSIYGADCVVVDGGRPDAEIADLVEVMVNPSLGDADAGDVPAAVLAANLALSVNPEVRADLRHLPAVSFWETTPESYADLAAEAGYDEAAVSDLREAVSLEAYYHAYEDKRELITDLLFDPEHRELAGHVAGQFREKLETELATARPHLSERAHGDLAYRVLDVESFTHRFDFPASELLLSELHRRERPDADGPLVTLGVDEAELLVESDEPVDLRAVAGQAREAVPDAGITAKGTTDGKLAFLRGERDAVVDAVVEAIADVRGD